MADAKQIRASDASQIGYVAPSQNFVALDKHTGVAKAGRRREREREKKPEGKVEIRGWWSCSYCDLGNVIMYREVFGVLYGWCVARK